MIIGCTDILFTVTYINGENYFRTVTVNKNQCTTTDKERTNFFKSKSE